MLVTWTTLGRCWACLRWYSLDRRAMMGLASWICCSFFSDSVAHTIGKTSTHRWQAM